MNEGRQNSKHKIEIICSRSVKSPMGCKAYFYGLAYKPLNLFFSITGKSDKVQIHRILLIKGLNP